MRQACTCSVRMWSNLIFFSPLLYLITTSGRAGRSTNVRCLTRADLDHDLSCQHRLRLSFALPHVTVSVAALSLSREGLWGSGRSSPHSHQFPSPSAMAILGLSPRHWQALLTSRISPPTTTPLHPQRHSVPATSQPSPATKKRKAHTTSPARCCSPRNVAYCFSSLLFLLALDHVWLSTTRQLADREACRLPTQGQHLLLPPSCRICAVGKPAPGECPPSSGRNTRTRPLPLHALVQPPGAMRGPSSSPCGYGEQKQRQKHPNVENENQIPTLRTPTQYQKLYTTLTNHACTASELFA